MREPLLLASVRLHPLLWRGLGRLSVAVLRPSKVVVTHGYTITKHHVPTGCRSEKERDSKQRAWHPDLS